MKSVIGCVVVGIAVSVHAQDFTSAPAKSARDTYLSTMSQADAKYKAGLESALRQAEMKKDAEEAARIQGALADIADNQALTETAGSELARLTFRTAKVLGSTPYQIGKVSKGDKIVVKYVKGKITHWGPLSSPDETDKVKCFLRGKVGAANVDIVVIPTGTQAKPFVYTLGDAFTDVTLGTWDNRDQGEAVYKVAIIRAK